MAKKTNQGVIIFAFLLLLLAGSVFAYLAFSPSYDSEGNKIVKKQVECSVTVDNNVFGNHFDTPNCYVKKTCTLLNSMSILGVQGNVKMYDSNGVLATEQFDFWRLGSQQVTLTGCTASTSVTLRLYDENNQKQGEDLTLQVN